MQKNCLYLKSLLYLPWSWVSSQLPFALSAGSQPGQPSLWGGNKSLTSGSWKCWYSTQHPPSTLPGLKREHLRSFAAHKSHFQICSSSWIWRSFTSKLNIPLDFKSCIFLLSSVNVTFPCYGAVMEQSITIQTLLYHSLHIHLIIY